MSWYGPKPKYEDFKYTKEMSIKKEHTEVIDLVKNEHKSPLEEINITYEEEQNLNTLSLHLKVLLNGKHIGNIVPDKASAYHPYNFNSMSAICGNTSSKEVESVKADILKTVTRIVTCFKEW